ncbi:hypothetical protein [Methylocystis sp. ATCC 49242]|uniref:hypothetical protein n=1 Tax=Methylocystis sp. ATCC 49242 TaxID=622637 RepID=UPI0001F879D4|nr:hypothetical protein [Methylocystis sp. ATCC 49242]
MTEEHISFARGVALAPSFAALRGLRIVNAHLVSIALLAVVLPLAIFAAHLEPIPAIILLLAAGLLVFRLSFSWAPGALLSARIDWTSLGGCLLLALALCLVSGEAHLFFSPYDWFVRDAVLSDLVANKYPVFYHYQGADFLMRAPLGMYMSPAAVGWSFGLRAAHFALLVQNAFLLGTILYLSAELVGGAKRRFIVLLLLFSPVDVVPHLAESVIDYFGTGAFVLSPHLMFWNRLVFYWGQIPSFFWAPNHALAAWLFAVLLFLEIRREIDIAFLGLAFIVLLFWSPLAMIGALPFLAWRVIRSLSPELVSRRNALALAAALCLLPLAYYLSLDAGRVTREWMFLRPDFWGWYLLLLVFGLPQAWILLSRWPDVAGWARTAVAIAIALLIVMPFYRIGVTVSDNDMTMRCALAPWFILGFGFSGAAQPIMDRGKALGALTFTLIALSAFTGLFEIRRGLSDPAYAINDCNLLTATEKVTPGFPISNYLAHIEKAPGWFVRDTGVRLAVERRLCWPGYPFLDNK